MVLQVLHRRYISCKLGKIAFSDITNNISMETIKMELMEFTAKYNFDSCCLICSKICKKYAIPCSSCKKLAHQKCTKTNLRDFRDIQDIQKWTCPKCMENCTPFYNLTNIELG